MYDAMDIAKYIIWKESNNGRPVNNLRLQKLLYFAYVNFLCMYNTPLFHELMQAWMFGPTIPLVHYRYLIYGNSAIPALKDFSDTFLSNKAKSCIDETLADCCQYSTEHLIDITRMQMPWIKAYHNPVGHTITPNSVLECYREQKETIYF